MEQSATLWSKLSEIAIESDDPQETLQDSNAVYDEENSSIKSVVNSSEVKCKGLMSSLQSTNDGDYRHFHSNVQNKSVTTLYPNESEQLLDAEKEEELPLNTNTDATPSHGVINELSSMKEVKEIKTTGDAVDSSMENTSEFVEQSNSDGESFSDEFSVKLLTRDELLALFKMLHMKKIQNTVDDSQSVLTTVGLVSELNKINNLSSGMLKIVLKQTLCVTDINISHLISSY